MAVRTPCATSRTHFRNDNPKNDRDDQVIKLCFGKSKFSGHALGTSNNCETDGRTDRWLVGWLVWLIGWFGLLVAWLVS